ncbi:hypothetical protein [Methylobacterium sp. Leaf117]|uniref:hypothetical protein n=1 Tax=Methylobacterium sp. Leaf117 TaxID=1736260 RepID=UPI0006F67416|nr:hypothetical protein [Methylobacterium sp. Leaf117]KQP80329.1 hypothetical protein ASF57_18285 [Methylobacterium sp. Leaf117]
MDVERNDAGRPDLAAALDAVLALTPSDQRKTAAGTFGRLTDAVTDRGVAVSNVVGLRYTTRRHIRNAWHAGFILAMARSRDPEVREKLRLLPSTLDLNRAEAVAETIEQGIRGISRSSAPIRQHLEMGLALVRATPTIIEALDGLAAIALPPAIRADPPASNGRGSASADYRRVRRRIRQLCSTLLRKRVGPAIQTLEAEPSAIRRLFEEGTTGARRFKSVASTLGGLAAKRAASTPRGATWRHAVAEALCKDLVDAMLLTLVDRLLTRHAGLTHRGEACSMDGMRGWVAVDLGRGSSTLRVGVAFDLTVPAAATGLTILGDAAETPLTFGEAERRLDMTIPEDLDKPAYRALRHLTRCDPHPVRGDVLDADTLMIATSADAATDPVLADRLANASERFQVTIMMAPGSDAGLAFRLAEAGFAWEPDERGSRPHMCQRARDTDEPCLP